MSVDDSSKLIGRTAFELPRFGVGTAPLGWLYSPVSDDQADETLATAISSGVRYIDTAPAYGLGIAEERLGASLMVAPSRPVISTKVGRRIVPSDVQSDFFPDAPWRKPVDAWDEAGLRATIEDSLNRLGIDRIDIAYVHDPDDVEDLVYSTTWPALSRLRDEGLVRAIGFGMNRPEMPTRFVQRLDVDVVLLAGRYTLLDQSALVEFLPACLENGTVAVCAGVLNTGILANPEAANATFDYAPASDSIKRRAIAIREICAAHGVSVAAAALQFPLRHPAVGSVVVGVRSSEEVTSNLADFSVPIPDELWADLLEAGVIAA